MARTGIALGSVLMFVIFVSQTLAKPQSDHDQLEEIQAEYSSYPEAASDHTENGGPGRFPPNASVPFQKTISRSRRSVSNDNWYLNHTTTPDINALYILATEAKTWAEARKFCQERDGHLAIINSIAESKIIARLNRHEELPQFGSADSNYVLIGFHQPFKLPDQYQTIDGRTSEQAGFAEWESGKPRNEEKCGAATRDGKLSSVDCDKKYAFVCEVPLRNNVAPAGPPGMRGETGVPGPIGSKGSQGFPGPTGLDGRKGEPGERGTDGMQGVAGQKGAKGDTGETGSSGPAGPRGEPGLGYDAACLAFLSNLQCSRGGGLIDGEQAPTFIGNINFAEECREFITKAYEQISRASSPNPAQPDGQEESPAKTCKDLFVAYPDMPSGEYWIDPNEGDVSDAILVHCDAEERSSCVIPRIKRIQPITHIGEEPEVWLSELGTEMQITYEAADHQISALQILSSHAEQTITYHCMKSVGYFDAESETYGRGLKLLAWNDFELQPTGNRLFRYDVTSDGCQDRPDEWNETVISYRTDRPSRLPVMDVGVRDVGKPDQQFSVEIGNVCFK